MKTILLIIAVSLCSISASAQSSIVKKNIPVSGECGMCKTTIESALKVNGVIGANWNPDTKILKLKFDQKLISLDSIQHLVALAGYDNDAYKASDKDYSSLHKCCQYERKK